MYRADQVSSAVGIEVGGAGGSGVAGGAGGAGGAGVAEVASLDEGLLPEMLEAKRAMERSGSLEIRWAIRELFSDLGEELPVVKSYIAECFGLKDEGTVVLVRLMLDYIYGVDVSLEKITKYMSELGDGVSFNQFVALEFNVGGESLIKLVNPLSLAVMYLEMDLVGLLLMGDGKSEITRAKLTRLPRGLDDGFEWVRKFHLKKDALYSEISGREATLDPDSIIDGVVIPNNIRIETAQSAWLARHAEYNITPDLLFSREERGKTALSYIIYNIGQQLGLLPSDRVKRFKAIDFVYPQPNEDSDISNLEIWSGNRLDLVKAACLYSDIGDECSFVGKVEKAYEVMSKLDRTGFDGDRWLATSLAESFLYTWINVRVNYKSKEGEEDLRIESAKIYYTSSLCGFLMQLMGFVRSKTKDSSRMKKDTLEELHLLAHRVRSSRGYSYEKRDIMHILRRVIIEYMSTLHDIDEGGICAILGDIPIEVLIKGQRSIGNTKASDYLTSNFAAGGKLGNAVPEEVILELFEINREEATADINGGITYLGNEPAADAEPFSRLRLSNPPCPRKR